LILTLAALELALRVIYGNGSFPELLLRDPGDGRCIGLRPSVAVPYTGHRFRVPRVIHDTNELGFRGAARAREKPPGSTRIANLGDSFVYGVGVESGATLSVVMERQLGADGSRPVEVLNFGIPGLNLSEAIDQYQLFARGWAPDVVLYFLFRNDLGRPICDALPLGLTPGKQLFERLYLVRVPVMYRITALVIRDEEVDVQVLTRRLERGIEEFAEAVADDGARLGVVVLDYPLRGTDPRPFTAWMEQRGIDYLDLSAFLLDPANRIPREGHLSVAGNARVAGAVAEWLPSFGRGGARNEEGRDHK
jgi:hypothetical protein